MNEDDDLYSIAPGPACLVVALNIESMVVGIKK